MGMVRLLGKRKWLLDNGCLDNGDACMALKVLGQWLLHFSCAEFGNVNEWSCMHGCALEFHHNNEIGLVHEATLDWSNVAVGC